MQQKFGLRKGKKNFLSEMKILHVLANADGSMGGAAEVPPMVRGGVRGGAMVGGAV